MNEFNSTELKILNLIKSGKTRSDILAEKISTSANVLNALYNIYSKTEDDVKYKTARNKFEELACYLRNNPDAFGPLLEVAEVEEEKVVGVVEEETLQGSTSSEDPAASRVMKAIDRIITKLHIKLEILDEVKAEIEKELNNG